MSENDTNRGRDLPKGPDHLPMPDQDTPDSIEYRIILARSKAMKTLEPYLRAMPENSLLPTASVGTAKTEEKHRKTIAKALTDAMKAGVPPSDFPEALFKRAGIRV